MLSQCCECKKVRQGSRWVKLKNSDLESIKVSHTYCPECAKQVMIELNIGNDTKSVNYSGSLTENFETA